MRNENLPPLTWLSAFEASARHLSFTRAAHELNLTQSAVSQHVRSLEAHLGRELFVRRTRGIALTEAGGNYVPVVREAFDLLASGTRAFTGGDRGRTMILQCNLAFSVFWLAPRLADLYARHPWLVLNIVTPMWDPDRQSPNAAAEIRFGLPDDMSPAAERLGHDRFFPVCAPDYHEGRPDLETAALFDCAGVSGSWSAWFRSQNAPFEREASITLASTFVIAIEAARRGAGVTLAHDTIVAGLLEEGALVRPFAHGPALPEGYFLLPPSRHAETPASRAFRDWIGETINAPPEVG